MCRIRTEEVEPLREERFDGGQYHLMGVDQRRRYVGANHVSEIEGEVEISVKRMYIKFHSISLYVIPSEPCHSRDQNSECITEISLTA